MAEAKKDKVLSPAYIAYSKVIEAYKVKNPTKYEIKKAVLEARLASL